MFQMWDDVEIPLQKPGRGGARAALLHETKEVLWGRVFTGLSGGLKGSLHVQGVGTG